MKDHGKNITWDFNHFPPQKKKKKPAKAAQFELEVKS